MQRPELGGWLRLTLTPGIGNTTARKLLAAFGLPEAVFAQSSTSLRQVVTTAQASALRSEPAKLAETLETAWRWLQASGHGATRRRIVTLGEPGYPSAFLDTDDPPLMLYLLGADKLTESELAVQLSNCIAVVGSRNPTPQGASNARQFSRALAQAGLTVVSGLALGIDGAAHEGALDTVEVASDRVVTVAVVGTGLDRVYPKRHLELAHRIAQHGLLLSEFPLGTGPLTANFPRRNRLIAGLARGTLVVEAALKSGSLITARLSVEQGKEVFAIPGSIHSPQSRGCHALIKQGAKLVESVQDVLEELNIGSASQRVAGPGTQRETSQVERTSADPLGALLSALGFDPVGLDALQERCQLDTATLQAQLMTLELGGSVARLPGALFQRLKQSD